VTGEREALIDVVAEWMGDKGPSARAKASQLVNRLLSERGTAPCPEKCVNGEHELRYPRETHGGNAPTTHRRCKTCNGSGSVDTGPLLVLASQLEQVTWGELNYDERGNFTGFDGGEHRTTGGRAWCLSCSEWCYESGPCACCVTAALPDEPLFILRPHPEGEAETK
jgi:hypothetical protein